MLKFLKMDFYRLLKQKSTIIIMAVAVGIVLMTVGTTRLEQALIESGNMPKEALEMLLQTQEGSEAGVSDIMSVGMNVNPSLEWMNPETEIPFFELVELITTSGMLTILVIVFAVLFGYAERKNGYIKNLVGQKHFKAKLYFSKMVAVSVYAIVLFAFTYLITLLFGVLLLKNPISFSASGNTIAAMFGQLLVNIVFGVFTVLLVAILEGTTVPIIIGTLICTGVSALLYSLVDKLVYKLADVKDFVLSSFLPSGQLKTMLHSSSGSTITKGVVVLLVFMVIYLVATFISAEKKDVN